jgi:regulator of protease activity HflC (stomatin/prohibitin superfamily)
MFTRVVIPDHERGFFYVDGQFRRLLEPGTHWLWTGLGKPEVKRIALTWTGTLSGLPDYEFLAARPEVAPHVTTYRMGDTERGIIFKSGNYTTVAGRGFHAFLRGPHHLRLEVMDASDPMLPAKYASVILRIDGLENWLVVHEVPSGHQAQLYYDNAPERLLEPGRYVFWTGVRKIAVVPVDVREQALEIQGQELMTSDKVTLRINLTARCSVTEVTKALSTQTSYKDALYRDLQLALREEVGGRTLDDLLARKDDLGRAVTERVRESAAAMGVALHGAGLKDVILPGEMRTILNQVIEAEKRAQANMIARREETAATRNLMNTAKLLENNPVLMHLKELESTERIAEKIGTLSVYGGLDGLLDILKKSTRPEKPA